jgi:hypothetical protein
MASYGYFLERHKLYYEWQRYRDFRGKYPEVSPCGWHFWPLSKDWPAEWHPLPPIFAFWYRFPPGTFAPCRDNVPRTWVTLGLHLLLPAWHVHWRWPVGEVASWLPIDSLEGDDSRIGGCAPHEELVELKQEFQHFPDFAACWEQSVRRSKSFGAYRVYEAIWCAQSRTVILEYVLADLDRYAEVCCRLQEDIRQAFLADEAQEAAVQALLQKPLRQPTTSPESSAQEGVRRLRREI